MILYVDIEQPKPGGGAGVGEGVGLHGLGRFDMVTGSQRRQELFVTNGNGTGIFIVKALGPLGLAVVSDSAQVGSCQVGPA